MTQYEFDQILEKYLAGTGTAEEAEVVQKWYERVSHRAEQTLPEAEAALVKMRIWRKIKAHTIVKKNRLLISWMRSGAVAASVVLLLVLGWLVIAKQNQNLPIPDALTQADPTRDIEIKNNSTKPQTINLKDGSLVILQPQSALSYAGHFGKTKRTVYLRGEGFFNIKRDTLKPFQVFTGEWVTEVLGTSFSIRQNTNAHTIEVVVKSGKVSVYEATRKNDAKKSAKILTQNHKALFRTDTKQLTTGIVAQPLTTQLKPLAEPSTTLTFEEVPLRMVFDRLEQLYLLDIRTEQESLNRCAFTGDLNGLAFFTQLDLICKSIGANYEINGTQIVIKGADCE
jgi:ferric-dicitrate binding protein FerR (iron transport regulator)